MKLVLTLFALIGLGQTAGAAEIVALGASNTAGRGIGHTADGVDTGQAFPAQLELLLKERNCNTSVLNAGVPGDTTYGLNQRLPGVVSADTKVLILEIPLGNDQRKNVTNTSENVASIKAYAQAHGITVVPLGNWLSVAGIEHREPDRQHFDAAGHLAMARFLLPRVRKAIACR